MTFQRYAELFIPLRRTSKVIFLPGSTKKEYTTLPVQNPLPICFESIEISQTPHKTAAENTFKQLY